MDEKSLGQRIASARKSAGLTQQQLCHKAGLSYSTLAKIERGAIKSPSVFTIAQIAGAAGASLEQLVGKSGASKSSNKVTSKSGVSFVFFDVNGCLVRFFHRAFTRLAEESGVPSDVIETAFWHYNDAVCRGELSMEDFNRKTAERIGIPSMDWQKYYLEAVDPIPQMQELVVWAADRYHVGLMTNIMPGFLDAMRSHKLIPKVDYTAIVDSSRVGSIKPEHKIYEAAQKMANCPPEQILLVDDSRANVMAAEKMGWHVLWFDDYRPSESAKHVRTALEPADS
jgi:glucose-1-phosphatase